jgi:hypothetical protein
MTPQPPKKTYSPPPNKGAAKAKPGAKPKPKAPPAVPPGQRPPFPPPGGGGGNRPDIIVGGASVVIQIGEVKITVEGPLLKVIEVLKALFGPGDQPAAMISRLQLVFGKEVQVKKR